MLIGALGVALKHRAWPGAINGGGDAVGAEQPHIGVERRARGRDSLTKHRLAVALQRLHQLGVAGLRFERLGQQQTLDLDPDAGVAGRSLGNDTTQLGLDLGRVLLGDHAAVQLDQHLARHHVGVAAALDAADVQVRVADAGQLGRDRLVTLILRVQRVEDHHRALQRIDPGLGDGGVGLLAVDGDGELQAAVVRGDHLVAETGRQQQVGLGQSVL